MSSDRTPTTLWLQVPTDFSSFTADQRTYIHVSKDQCSQNNSTSSFTGLAVRPTTETTLGLSYHFLAKGGALKSNFRQKKILTGHLSVQHEFQRLLFWHSSLPVHLLKPLYYLKGSQSAAAGNKKEDRMQLTMLGTLANHQTQKYFHFFIMQGYTSQTRTISALTLFSLKVTLRNDPIAVV